MAHKHSVYDTDNHFKINGITRAITDVSNSKTAVVQYDHNSERFTFELPRFIEGHDMMKCNEVQVHWKNGTASGVYVVTDFQVSPENAEVVVCSWLISKSATQFAGTLEFLLRFACITEFKPDYVWNTAIYTRINVLAGMFNKNETALLGVAILGNMKLA